MRSLSLLVPAILLAIWEPNASAAAQTLLRLGPMATYVNHSGVDTVGRQLAYEVRELLAQSKTYPSVPSIEQAYVVIHLATIDLDEPGDDGRVSAVAYALTYDFAAIANRPEPSKQLRFVNNGILLVGRQKVREMASSIVAQVDASMRSIK